MRVPVSVSHVLQAVGRLAVEGLLPALLAWLPEECSLAATSLLPKVRHCHNGPVLEPAYMSASSGSKTLIRLLINSSLHARASMKPEVLLLSRGLAV